MSKLSEYIRLEEMGKRAQPKSLISKDCVQLAAVGEHGTIYLKSKVTLNEAHLLLAWLKDLLEEPDKQPDKKCVVRWKETIDGNWITTCNYVLPMRPDSLFCPYCGGWRRVEGPTL